MRKCIVKTSSQLHSPPALPPRKMHSVPIEQESAWTLWKIRKITPLGYRTWISQFSSPYLSYPGSYSQVET
jgi:hypothetical protein